MVELSCLLGVLPFRLIPIRLNGLGLGLGHDALRTSVSIVTTFI